MRVMIYDSGDKLSPFWATGQIIGNFKKVFAVKTWDEAYQELSEVSGTINHLQVWGHGYSGKPLMDGVKVNLDLLKASLDGKIIPDTVVWFRSCSVFSRDIGKDFAENFVETLNCKVAAHTHIVSSPWPTHQSGGHGLKPGQKAYWSSSEGVNPDGSDKGSTPFAVNTCWTTTMMVPKEWWKD